ncbi:MAG: prepilin-type N-terminal cleavage/methylation domain-containing protein [Chlamydiales bacterium]|nr:prepilin-type N-terminal cleavage/methylation domain-containing protein [Chlamydiales bacterium]
MRGKRPFSLLEVILCIAILAIISGFLGVEIKDTINYQRFESSVAGFVSDLRRVQALALSYQGEFNLTLVKHENGYAYAFFSDEPKEMVRKLPKGTLHGVKSMHLDNRLQEKVSITIFATGRVEPSKKLKIGTDSRTLALDLGSPLKLIEMKHEES